MNLWNTLPNQTHSMELELDEFPQTAFFFFVYLQRSLFMCGSLCFTNFLLRELLSLWGDKFMVVMDTHMEGIWVNAL